MMSSIKLILFDFGGVIASEGYELGLLKLSGEFKMSYPEMYKIARNNDLPEEWPDNEAFYNFQYEPIEDFKEKE